MSSLDIEGRGVRPDRVDFMTLPVALLYHEWTTEWLLVAASAEQFAEGLGLIPVGVVEIIIVWFVLSAISIQHLPRSLLVLYVSIRLGSRYCQVWLIVSVYTRIPLGKARRVYEDRTVHLADDLMLRILESVDVQIALLINIKDWICFSYRGLRVQKRVCIPVGDILRALCNLFSIIFIQSAVRVRFSWAKLFDLQFLNLRFPFSIFVIQHVSFVPWLSLLYSEAWIAKDQRVFEFAILLVIHDIAYCFLAQCLQASLRHLVSNMVRLIHPIVELGW